MAPSAWGPGNGGLSPDVYKRQANDLGAAVIASIRDITKLRGEVVFCAGGSLPNDGKVIEDLRKYE